MYFYLNASPDVFMSPVKEPHFFGEDLYDPNHIQNIDDYLDLFKDARNEKIIGEASVWYLYSKTAAKEIFDFSPQAKLLIHLRDPREMIPSLHNHHLFRGYLQGSDSSSFRTKIDYTQLAAYASQIDRYLDVFPAEQIKIVFFEDFVNDTGKVFADIMNFLNVNDQFQPEFIRHNPRRTHRIKNVEGILNQLRSLAKKIPLSKLKPFYKRVDRLLRQWNTQVISNENQSEILSADICRALIPEIQKLEQLTGRNLAHWAVELPEVNSRKDVTGQS